MIDIALLILFCFMAYRLEKALRLESGIFNEFKLQSKIRLAVLFFPVGSLLILIGSALFPLNVIGALACFIYPLAISRRLSLALEKAGTDRVKGAQATISQVFGTALIGLIYVTVHIVMTIATGTLSSIV